MCFPFPFHSIVGYSFMPQNLRANHRNLDDLRARSSLFVCAHAVNIGIIFRLSCSIHFSRDRKLATTFCLFSTSEQTSQHKRSMLKCCTLLTRLPSHIAHIFTATTHDTLVLCFLFFSVALR